MNGLNQCVVLLIFFFSLSLKVKIPAEFMANVKVILQETFQHDEGMIRDALKEFDEFPKYLSKMVRVSVIISSSFRAGFYKNKFDFKISID